MCKGPEASQSLACWLGKGDGRCNPQKRQAVKPLLTFESMNKSLDSILNKVAIPMFLEEF